MIDRSNGTNGPLSIEEVMKKDPLVEELLDEGEVVEYISYKKGKNYKSLVITIFVLIFIMIKIFPWGRTLYGEILFIFATISLILFSFLIILGTLKGKLIITNKGIIVRSFTKLKIKDSLFATEKFYYPQIKKIERLTLENIPVLRFTIRGREYSYKSYPIFSDIKMEEIEKLSEFIKKNINEKELREEVEIKRKNINETLKEEKVRRINEILDQNEDIKNSITRTNGNLTIGEVLLKHPKVENVLDEGEKIKYIVYKKKNISKTMPIFLLVISLFFFYIFYISKQAINSFLFMINLAFFLIGLNLYKKNKEILVFTNKSFLLKRKRNILKIYYENLKNIILVFIKNDTSINIVDENKSTITTSQKQYVQFDMYNFFKKINESIKWDNENKNKKSGKIIILILFLGIIVPFFLGLLNFISLTSSFQFIFTYINILLFINLFLPI